MKYRHAFHAGNFADVHKHVALLALIDALARKPKGFLCLDTHAGAGQYALGGAPARKTGEAALGIGRLEGATLAAPELRDYVAQVAALRAAGGDAGIYPGSPLLAASRLRAQDRLIAIELDPLEAEALAQTLGGRALVERGDGFARLRAHLPPPERRGLVLIDPPYEETAKDFGRVSTALLEALGRFETGVYCIWYPIKDRRSTDRWRSSVAAGTVRETLACEMWLHPTDSAAGLNGSGLLIVNPPWQLRERMQAWLPELVDVLGAGPSIGHRVEILNAASSRV